MSTEGSCLFARLVVYPRDATSFGDGPWNMAADEHLLAQAAHPTLRLYGWTAPAVTLGYFQSLAAVGAGFSGLPLTRRWTGGGAVLHGDPCELTYALAIPGSHPFARRRPQESYQLLHGSVAAALRACDVPAILVDHRPPESGLTCFQHPVPGDVISPDGQKLAGAAQRRAKNGLLIQGSVRLTRPLPPQLSATLAAVLGDHLLAPPPLPQAVIETLATEKYRLPSWQTRVP